MAKRVLIISRDFPPFAGGGTRRVGAFAHFLTREGFSVETVARSGAPSRAFQSPSRTMLEGARRLRLGRLMRTTMRWLAVPDDGALDIPFICAAARGARPDLIIASGLPASILIAGHALSRWFGVPWIADFRDPWREQARLMSPTEFHADLHALLEEKTLETAAAVTTATSLMAEWLRARVPATLPVRAIFNGYDRALFTGPAPAVPPASAGIVVGHYGSFYGSRDPDALCKAIAQTGATLEQAGSDFNERLARAQARHGARVSQLGVLSNREAVDRMRRAHVLALIIHAGEDWRHMRTQKLAEYLAAGRPILVMSPECEAADVVRELDAGIVVDSEDAAGAARAIPILAARTATRPPPPELAWEAQVGALASIIRGILES